ncbi:hypothetical protein BTO06_10810 [Tenacibaculum sp. SZ-18]|uniref:hypothetical protein n=1 Tax=Tenacibaculum sp. SZ-18 TaxID=754423 RepID=UPI000C2CE817|nr:hypothetical protein [Tenacibaculum sp. SZ-18]AUC15605.1 hypothetical protein BTO06_10810 [Tenacibaculum sp. SZ-18]
MKKLIALYVLCTSCVLFGQTKFEKGYFITTKGNKVECLIKNEDWIGIPDRIEYKLDVNSKVNSMGKENLTKVHIVDKILLERHEVLIERYSKNLDELSISRLIKPKKESLLLKVIADGKAKLLKYDFKGVQYFFYELNSNINSLEYKLYKTSKGYLGRNLNYQKILKDKLNCSNKNLKSNIKYKEKSLVNYFIDYNSCSDSSTEVYSQEIKKGKFNIRGKISLGKSKFKNNQYQFVYKIGSEIEYVLPFNNSKWSVFFEPTFQSYSNNEGITIGSITFIGVSGGVYSVPRYYDGEVSYKSIELPFGARHYFYLNDNNKLFANGGFIVDWALTDYLITNPNDLLPISTTVNYFLGFGYEINKRYSIEFRFNTPRTISSINERGSSTSDYTNFSFKLGYNFL